MSNVYANLASIVSNLLIGNIGTLQTHTNTLELWTQTNEALTFDWTNGMPPTNGNTPWVMYEDHHTDGDNTWVEQFLKNWMTPEYLDDFSQAFGIDIMQWLESSWDSTKGPAQMSYINQFISLINSKAQEEEQTGQTMSKTEGSVVQQDGSVQQSIADMGSTINGAGGNIASLLQQPF